MNTKLNPAGWVRLVLYVLSALVGVAAVLATTLGYGELAGLLGTLAGTGAAVTGGTAAYNLPKAPDQNSALGGLDVTEILKAIPVIAGAAQTYQQAMEYQPRHAARDEPAPVASGLPVYDGPTTNDE